jgi:hypothetical protein
MTRGDQTNHATQRQKLLRSGTDVLELDGEPQDGPGEVKARCRQTGKQPFSANGL